MARAFQGLRHDPRDNYDAIVIGAGIGGLVCGIVLARAGIKTLLVEQHYMAGGYCSTFRRCGYTFDSATHFYPLLGNPVTITGRHLEELGVRCRWIKMDPVDHFHFPDGSEFRVPADFNVYLERLKSTFPDEHEAINAFFALARQAYLAGLLYFFRDRESGAFEAMRSWTVRDIVDRYFRNPKLKLALTADCSHWGAPPSHTSFVFDSMLRLSYFLGNYYPAGSSQAFADALAARFEQSGGDILMSSSVTRILTRRARAHGVEVETGIGRNRHRVRVSASEIVSNGDLLYTLERLLDPGVADRELISELKKFRLSRACFIHHVALGDTTRQEISKLDGYHWNCWDAERVAQSSLKLFVPTLYDPTIAPEGGQIVVAQKLSDADYPNVTDWRAQKAIESQGVIERLRAILPNYDRRVVWQASASAQTSSRFTLNRHGAMLGWEMSCEQLGEARPDPNGRIRGLHFAGHWTRPGGGVTPVIVSAMKTARAIIAGQSRPNPMPLPEPARRIDADYGWN